MRAGRSAWVLKFDTKRVPDKKDKHFEEDMEIRDEHSTHIWRYKVVKYGYTRWQITPASNPNSKVKGYMSITSASTPSVMMKCVRRQRLTGCIMA